MEELFPSIPQKVYSVSELTQEIKEALEERFPHVWVEGEISNLHLHSSGHLYLTLKDARSQIRAVMFRAQARELGFQPEDGMRVLCLGRVGVYEVRGEYQLYVDFMEPRGVGALQKAFEQLKARLQEEGLFDQARKRPLPFLPQRIGIVTSPTGAVIRDMLNILGRRFTNLHILVRPVKVQGEGAAREIAEGLDDLNRIPDLDLIVVARGGGSLEDLWAFNEEEVALAIARSRVPVVSAVGHEVDFTISDFVADLRAPTPSAAAELIVPVRRDLVQALSNLRDDLQGALERAIAENREAVGSWAKRLPDPRRRVADHRLLLDDLHNRLNGCVRQAMGRAEDGLRHETALLLRADPGTRAQAARGDVGVWGDRLIRALGAVLQTSRQGLEREAALLHSMSPLTVLARGYSITRRIPTGEVMRDASVLSSGDRLRITFHRGEATCQVEKPTRRRKVSR